MNALAASSSGYQALVCIFMYGGNDSNNTIIPFDTKGYKNYSTIRGPLALPQGKLLQLGKSPNFALHPALGDIRTMYENGTAAVVTNVGTLVQPLSKSQYLEGSLPTPSGLFSHPDQQSEWQNASQSGSTRTGWAGRIADKLTPVYNSNATIPMITSLYGDTLFCNGADMAPAAVTAGNIEGGQCSIGSAPCPGRLQTAQRIVTFSSGVSLVQADNEITKAGYENMTILSKALKYGKALKTEFPANNSLAAQLQQIAEIIQVRSELGVGRQIFFAGLGNFDTHANQLDTQDALLSLVSPAMSAFYDATVELGLAKDITTFTMSDFSRAFQPNSNNGSDHAWGGHHIVMGGAVQGGKMYGTFPTLALGGPNDSDVNGRWIPTTSSVQYAATLASWFGVPASSLSAVFPNIGEFSTKDLGFLS
jgi:uncharacterized protein (DUF1501 family)